MVTDNDDQRQFFRLYYPPALRPSIHIKARRYLVTEVSEAGIRFLLMPLTPFHIGQQVRGALGLLHGVIMPVQGIVLRYTADGEVVLHLSQGIPLSVMMQEQLRVIATCAEI